MHLLVMSNEWHSRVLNTLDHNFCPFCYCPLSVLAQQVQQVETVSTQTVKAVLDTWPGIESLSSECACVPRVA